MRQNLKGYLGRLSLIHPPGIFVSMSKSQKTQQRVNRPNSPTVSLIIPVRNEAENLKHVLPLVPSCVTELVIVDGKSTDDTIGVTQSFFPDAVVVHQTETNGKGAAMIEGAIASSGDIIVYIDGDGSMDPGEIPEFVGTLQSGADLAKGSRFAAGGYSHDITPIRRLGNWGLLSLAKILFRQKWTDLNYGFFALWSDMLPVLGLDSICPSSTESKKMPYGYGFEIETMTFTRAVRSGLRVAEVGSIEYERIYGESSLMAIKDGFRILGALRRERGAPITKSFNGNPTLVGVERNNFISPNIAIDVIPNFINMSSLELEVVTHSEPVAKFISNAEIMKSI